MTITFDTDNLSKDDIDLLRAIITRDKNRTQVAANKRWRAKNSNATTTEARVADEPASTPTTDSVSGKQADDDQADVDSTDNNPFGKLAVWRDRTTGKALMPAVDIMWVISHEGKITKEQRDYRVRMIKDKGLSKKDEAEAIAAFDSNTYVVDEKLY